MERLGTWWLLQLTHQVLQPHSLWRKRKKRECGELGGTSLHEGLHGNETLKSFAICSGSEKWTCLSQMQRLDPKKRKQPDGTDLQRNWHWQTCFSWSLWFGFLLERLHLPLPRFWNSPVTVQSKAIWTCRNEWVWGAQLTRLDDRVPRDLLSRFLFFLSSLLKAWLLLDHWSLYLNASKPVKTWFHLAYNPSSMEVTILLGSVPSGPKLVIVQPPPRQWLFYTSGAK